MNKSAPVESIVHTQARFLDRAWKVDAAGVLILGVLSLIGYLAGLGPFLEASAGKARHEQATAAAIQERDDARHRSTESKRHLIERRKQIKTEAVTLQQVDQRHLQIGAIAQLAQATSVAVDQISPADAIEIKGVASVVRVPITLTGKGSYVQISRFLGALHEQFRDTAVASVQVSAQPGSNGSVATFSVVLYWYAHPDMPS